MKNSNSLLFISMFLLSGNAVSGGLSLSERDCMDILEKWAVDPDSVPPHLVNHCRDMMVADGIRQPAGTGFPLIEPAAGGTGSDGSGIPLVEPAAGKSNDLAAQSMTDDDRANPSISNDGSPIALGKDPCSEPSGSGSIYCWGPWESIAPAAGPVVVAAGPPQDIDGPIYEPQPEDFPPELVPPSPGSAENLPLGSCTAGESCGFATLVDGTTTRADSDDTELVAFHLEQDGTQFVVDPGRPNEIVSNDNLDPRFIQVGDQEIMISEGTIGSIESKLQARVFRDDNGNILQSADIWKQGDILAIGGDSTNQSSGNSGEYAWGIASSQATLDALNSGGQGISVNFSGAMAVDQSTIANMTVNLGTEPNWTGQWVNPAYNFGAGGSVSGADLISDPSQFTKNVLGNSYVQGALLGEQNNQSVAHAIDVNLDTVGNIKDVGLLRAVQQ